LPGLRFLRLCWRLSTTFYKKGKPCVPMRGLAVLLVAVAIHMIGFGMVIPVMPFLLRELGGDAAVQGFLVSLFSLFQLLSAPLWGALADRLGKTRIVASGLLLSALGNAVAYFSNSLFSLAVARAVAGLGGGTIGALQALVADLSPPERRASSMALFGMAFGAGLVLGPVLGGVAGNIAPRLPFLLATAMSVAAAAVVTRIPVVRGRVQWTFKLKLGLLSVAVLLLNFSFSMFEGLVSYYGADVFRMTPSQIGVLMLVVGVAAMAGQIAVRRLEGRLASGTATAVGVAITSFGLALLASGELPLLYLGAALASVGQLIAASNLFAIASSISGAGGTSFGILQSAGSLGRLVGPAAAGLIYTHLGPPYVFLTSALVALSIVPIALRHLATHQ